jgi:hypothetical protein
MMSSLSFRAAIAVAALAATGVAQSQATAPAPSPTQPTPLAVPQGVQPSGAQAATPPAPVPAKAAPGTEAPAAAGTPVEQKPMQKRQGTGKSNYMPANPDATPIVPGQPPKSQGAQSGQGGGAKRSGQGSPWQSQSGAQAGAASAAGQPPGGVQAGSGKGKRPAGMGRAFTNLQTQEEYAAYAAKARNVKTHGECKALLETTMKELEPRAKAENKPMSVNPTAICDSAKARGRVTG